MKTSIILLFAFVCAPVLSRPWEESEPEVGAEDRADRMSFSGVNRNINQKMNQNNRQSAGSAAATTAYSASSSIAAMTSTRIPVSTTYSSANAGPVNSGTGFSGIACTPDVWPAIGKNGQCTATANLDAQCSTLEIAASAQDCATFAGNWCCYTPLKTSKITQQKVVVQKEKTPAQLAEEKKKNDALLQMTVEAIFSMNKAPKKPSIGMAAVNMLLEQQAKKSASANNNLDVTTKAPLIRRKIQALRPIAKKVEMSTIAPLIRRIPSSRNIEDVEVDEIFE